MIRKKIGTLFGKPIIQGDANFVRNGEIYYQLIDNVVVLSSRDLSGKLMPITRGIYTLNVTVEGPEGTTPEEVGSVTIAPNKKKYIEGDTVVLTAEAEDGYEFSKWVIGEDELTDAAIAIDMLSDLSVKAVFVVDED